MNRSLLTCILHEYMWDTQKKWVILTGDLIFRLNTILIRKRERCKQFRGE